MAQTLSFEILTQMMCMSVCIFLKDFFHRKKMVEKLNTNQKKQWYMFIFI